MNKLAEFTDDELRAELARRRRSVCQCGPWRREITEKTVGFHPRTGCTNCNLWDDVVRPL